MLNRRLVLRRFFVLIFFALTSHLSAQQRESVAVLELDPTGLSADDSRTITESLRDYLRATPSFNVMGGALTAQMIRDRAPDKSPPFVDNNEIIEIGRLLNVTRVVSGRVSRIGSLYAIALKVSNVETGEVSESSKSAVGTLSAFLTTSLKQAVDELFPPPSSITVSGYVRLASGEALAGVLIEVGDEAESVATEADGAYSLDLPFNWSGDIAPVLQNYTFAPDKISVAGVTENLPNQNFTASLDVVPPPQLAKTKGKSKKWLLFVLGGGAAAGGAFVLLSSGGENPIVEPPVGLPRPPDPDN